MLLISIVKRSSLTKNKLNCFSRKFLFQILRILLPNFVVITELGKMPKDTLIFATQSDSLVLE